MCKNPNYKIILGEKSLHAKVFELWDVICGVAYSPIDEWSLLFYIRYNSNIYYRSYSRFNLNRNATATSVTSMISYNIVGPNKETVRV